MSKWQSLFWGVLCPMAWTILAVFSYARWIDDGEILHLILGFGWTVMAVVYVMVTRRRKSEGPDKAGPS